MITPTHKNITQEGIQFSLKFTEEETILNTQLNNQYIIHCIHTNK